MTILHKCIISPPFGAYIKIKNMQVILGSFTVKKRSGRVIQAIKTIRYIKGKGWINKIGLRNPGIKSIKHVSDNAIISFAALKKNDFSLFKDYLTKFAKEKNIANIEINESCPNSSVLSVKKQDIENFMKLCPVVIVKLPHLVEFDRITKLYQMGVKYFHISNTLACSRGGISGPILKEKNLLTIKALKTKFPDTKIIGGGGIYSIQDALDYQDNGADFFSISSVFFNPLKAFKLVKCIKKM